MALAASVDGSSPRVRGTPTTRQAPSTKRRFIPACAGNSKSTRKAAKPRSVHPRVCGELCRAPLGLRMPAGSSPRVRGTRSRQGRPRRSTTVHPRVCGELAEHLRRAGSSCRFIPACAGNSLSATRPRCSKSVHPRVCGELIDVADQIPDSSGSSPRVRGTRRERIAAVLRARFIPACAGNSRWRAKCACWTTVHPRVCGELSGSTVLSRLSDGSSPRVRGTPNGRLRCLCCVAVHPRVCGELACVLSRARPRGGSSPRVRGTPPASAARFGRGPVHPRVCGELLSAAGEALQCYRFIPACAGNSARLANGASNPYGSSPRVRGTRRGGRR